MILRLASQMKPSWYLTRRSLKNEGDACDTVELNSVRPVAIPNTVRIGICKLIGETRPAGLGLEDDALLFCPGSRRLLLHYHLV
jgi:hypothetical protein